MTTLAPATSGRVRVEVRPAEVDDDAALRFFVVELAPSGNSIATFDGTRFHAESFAQIGGNAITEAGTCAIGSEALALLNLTRTHGERAILDLSEAALRARPLRGRLYVGYGRDEADALAKGTFVELRGY